MLVKLVDGGILNIISDTDWSSGCETCDFGSSYVNEFDIEMTNGIIKIEVVQMYEYALSEGQMLNLVLPNVDKIKEMTEEGFFEWIKKELEKELDESEDADNPTVTFEFVKKQ